MAKWLDKYENGGEYLGTTNVGRNYSPAWGGQFQMGGYVYPTTFVPQAEMGGSIPGSVGFTYARTGSTPSEGPYAKKTLPSAQDGVKKQKEWLRSYIQSPKYRERLKKEFAGKDDKFIDNEVNARLNNLLNEKIDYVKSISKNPGSISGMAIPKQYEGEYYDYEKNKFLPSKWEPDPFKRGYDKKGHIYLESEYNPNNWHPHPGYETIPLHELGHAIDDGGYRIPLSTKKKIYNYTKIGVRPNYRSQGMTFDYYNTPTEFINRIQPIRYLLNSEGLYDTRTKDFTEKDYDNMMKNEKINRNVHYQEVMEYLKGNAEQKKKAFIDLMNSVAINNNTDSNVAKNGMTYYQHGLDWTPRNISKNGSDIPKAQPGITEPLRGDIQTRGNQNLLTEIAAQKTKEKKAQAARERTTIGADTRTAKQKEKDRQAYESKLKYEKEVLGKDFETPQYLQEKNRARAEHLIHLADVGSMGAGLVEGVGKLALKNVPKPTSLSSSVENVGNKFKSEIDWGAWNPETPNYPELINEYNAIEESTKKVGTWMKNPDGSPFQGTPEQFIQQQSSYFKKAFGESKLINESGSPLFLYHGSAKKFNEFDPSKFQLGDAGYSGAGIYTTPSKVTANSYATSSAKFHSGDIEPTVYQLYGQGNNPIRSSELIKENKGRDLFNFYRDRNWKGELSPYESLREYDVAVSDQLPNVENIRLLHDAREIVFPRNTQVKSAVGNVGFFDMNNPNIYKALVPAVVGAGALQQKKQGGVVKDNMGYWNPDNWGKVVEIDSPNITMQGVNQDLIGISDEGDVQYMEPGKDYKFKGKKVKEYPVAKYGVNQQDEKTAQHLDQLTNFTNYNKPKAKSGGWLDKY
jgi:hypothetical protein